MPWSGREATWCTPSSTTPPSTPTPTGPRSTGTPTRPSGLVTGPFEPRNWCGDVVDSVVAEGRLVPHGSIDELADAIGVDRQRWSGPSSATTASPPRATTPTSARPGSSSPPVARPPFYGVLVRPTVVNLTSSGLRIDADARVLTSRGTPVPGLHAAGECVGGIIGPVYVGSGNSLGTCTTMGRVAGRTAASTSMGTA